MNSSMKISFLIVSLVLSVSLLAGCNNTESGSSSETSSSTEQSSTSVESSDSSKESADENQAAAEQLLVDLTGKYEELWNVVLADEYKQIWLDDAGEIVGGENAEAAVEKLSGMVTAEIYGEDAVKAYKDGNFAYDCSFTEDLKTLEFDGSNYVIKGYDADGKDLFSHTYHYIGMENTRGLYEFESDDENSGEFTYFFLAPDTSDTTYHIEFRYGSDAQQLSEYDKGKYAYWLASGISTEADDEMIRNCIQLFCTENLSE